MSIGTYNNNHDVKFRQTNDIDPNYYGSYHTTVLNVNLPEIKNDQWCQWSKELGQKVIKSIRFETGISDEFREMWSELANNKRNRYDDLQILNECERPNKLRKMNTPICLQNKKNNIRKFSEIDDGEDRINNDFNDINYQLGPTRYCIGPIGSNRLKYPVSATGPIGVTGPRGPNSVRYPTSITGPRSNIIANMYQNNLKNNYRISN
jgi:hypothetical protein